MGWVGYRVLRHGRLLLWLLLRVLLEGLSLLLQLVPLVLLQQPLLHRLLLVLVHGLLLLLQLLV